MGHATCKPHKSTHGAARRRSHAAPGSRVGPVEWAGWLQCSQSIHKYGNPGPPGGRTRSQDVTAKKAKPHRPLGLATSEGLQPTSPFLNPSPSDTEFKTGPAAACGHACGPRAVPMACARQAHQNSTMQSSSLYSTPCSPSSFSGYLSAPSSSSAVSSALAHSATGRWRSTSKQ